MRIGTKLILIILLINQFSFGQSNQIDSIPDDTLEIEEDIEIKFASKKTLGGFFTD